MFPGYNLWEEYSQLVEMRKWEVTPLSLNFPLGSVIRIDGESLCKQCVPWAQAEGGVVFFVVMGKV